MISEKLKLAGTKNPSKKSISPEEISPIVKTSQKQKVKLRRQAGETISAILNPKVLLPSELKAKTYTKLQEDFWDRCLDHSSLISKKLEKKSRIDFVDKLLVLEKVYMGEESDIAVLESSGKLSLYNLKDNSIMAKKELSIFGNQVQVSQVTSIPSHILVLLESNELLSIELTRLTVRSIKIQKGTIYPNQPNL